MDKIRKFEYHGKILKYIRPTECPRCLAGVANDPCYSGYFERETYNKNRLFTVTECHACQYPFLSVYQYDSDDDLFHIMVEYPKTLLQRSFSEYIQKAYPDFVSFYHQSEQAEQHKLLDICGTGYRKALEFLIKTYLIDTKGEDRNVIEKESLGNCIGRIDNPLLKACACNAARLGNDQTHYRKKYADYDIETLKWFLHNVVAFIDLEYSASEQLIPTAP